ncbi:MAG TPA: hypothetical protein IAC41_06460 [Candidatus Merdenecus merdavium]|nr:hypothetical protein [Candidatus Merdenecus merdavium]
MNDKKFNQWIDELEEDTRELPDDLEDLYTDIIQKIESSTSDKDSLKEKEELKKSKNVSSFFLSKVGLIVIVGIILIGMSTVVYAAISGQLQGIFKSTSEIEKQINIKRPEINPTTEDMVTEREEVDEFTINSNVVDETSFEDNLFRSVVTDMPLAQLEKDTYSEKDLIFDQENIAIFTKENGEGWKMKKGDTMELSISIDPTFADSEQEGESIRFAYVFQKKYNILTIEKINNENKIIKIDIPEDGEYFPAIENISLTYIKINEIKVMNK